MIEAAGTAGRRLSTVDRGDLALGVAWDPTPWTAEEGLGPLGIRVAVVDVDGQETAYVLVDGNNMEPGLRGELLDALVAEGPVDAAEILTTDTHVVNTVEADNQVGAAIPWDRLAELVCDLVDEARADREPVEAGAATERATVTIFGNDRTETLASHANAVVAMGGAFAVSVVLAAVAVSVLIFLFA
jgi:putative membrane protein